VVFAAAGSHQDGAAAGFRMSSPSVGSPMTPFDTLPGRICSLPSVPVTVSGVGGTKAVVARKTSPAKL
jgi:hypothetical protein